MVTRAQACLSNTPARPGPVFRHAASMRLGNLIVAMTLNTKQELKSEEFHGIDSGSAQSRSRLGPRDSSFLLHLFNSNQAARLASVSTGRALEWSLRLIRHVGRGECLGLWTASPVPASQ